MATGYLSSYYSSRRSSAVFPKMTDNLPPPPPPIRAPAEEVAPQLTTKALSTGQLKPKERKKKKKRKVPKVREKMKDGEMVKSESFVWKVLKLLGSGGFGDVYRVTKHENLDRREYAMKTEIVAGDKRMMRLKIEVTVLKLCSDQTEADKKRHFVEYIDRGITDKFKFLVMSLIGPSLDDIRRQYLLKNYSRPTAMNVCLQTLKAVADLHNLGYLHRDIKPANYAVGLGEREDTVYMLDFGIARKIFKGNTRDLKLPRAKVKFLGTLRFASRACHREVEQGRKDDLETWLYMAFDLLDDSNGIPWKRAADKNEVIHMKNKFFAHGFPKIYKIAPKEMRKIVDYINGMTYADLPDYNFIEQSLLAICRDHDINPQKKLDWAGKLKKKPQLDPSSSDTSSDNRQSGSDSDSGDKKPKKKQAAKSKSKGR